MPKRKLSLIDLLTHPNPKICNEHSWTGDPTTSKNRAWIRPDDIREWKGFDYGELKSTYCNVLKCKIKQDEIPDFESTMPFHLTEIRDEDSLEALLIRWNNAVVSSALAISQRDDEIACSTPDTESDEIFMARGGQGWIPNTDMTKRELRPDWAGIQSNKTRKAKVGCQNRICYINVLPGDTKLSTKWNSMLYKENGKLSKYVDPFYQIFTYCERAGARYGYLLTQEELVVVQVSHRWGIQDEAKASQDAAAATQINEYNIRQRKPLISVARDSKLKPGNAKGNVERILEWKCIPWENSNRTNSEQMTVNLALWYLHMLAKKNGSIERALGELQPGGLSTSFNSEKGRHSFDECDLSQESKSTGISSGRKRRKKGTEDSGYYLSFTSSF